MIAAIAIAVAVTLGLWVAFEAYHSRLLVSFMQRWRFAALRSPALISTPVREIDGMLGVIRKLLAGTAGLVIGFAAYGVTAALGISAARAEPSPCMPAALDVAWTKAPGVTARRITRDGVNLAAVVEAFLANKGAPDLGTDDFIVVNDSEKVIVKPVRAGLVCRNFVGIAIPLGTGGQELLKEIELAELGRGRA